MQKNLDLNTATEQELSSIQGMDKNAAKKIIDYRTQKGTFHSWEDFKTISGLPGTTMDTLKRNGFTIGGKAA